MRNQIRRFDRNGSFFPSLLNRYLKDDLYNNFFEGDLPATNVSENENMFNIELSIPGYTKDDIKIEVEKNVLKISAQTEVKNEEKDENQKIHRQEFRSSSFSRSFVIPEHVDTENISASQKDGILQIVLPKLNRTLEDKIKKIEIK